MHKEKGHSFQLNNLKIIYSHSKVNQIHFEIIDNGNGFVEQEVEAGNGLLNMRKRALELGNELIINSEKGKGTSIKFEV